MRRLKIYDNDTVIHTYTTDHKFQGSKQIEIEGPATITKCLVDYPALVNGKFGIITFDQPIKTPLYDMNLVPQPFPIEIGRGTFKFKHLMFNGPSYFNIRVDKYKPKMYIGNLITKEFIPELKTIEPVYTYRKKNNNIWNERDLHKLEQLCKQ